MLTNSNGMEVELLSVGARINKMKAPSSKGGADIMLGFNTGGSGSGGGNDSSSSSGMGESH